ncbi:MAG: VOC family protein [Terracidiphilus sp.]|nr:VOC family protein [Terracidiphilus sp.]
MSENRSLTPHIVVSNAAAAIDFYKAAFGAVETARHMQPNSNKIMHASLNINGGVLMLNDDFSDSMGCKSETPEALGGSPITFHLEVPDADAAWGKALAAGAQVKFPLADQFWGARYGQVTDPFGHYWSIAHTLATPTKAEMEEGAKAAFAH